MKVRELIKALSAFDEDLDVKLLNDTLTCDVLSVRRCVMRSTMNGLIYTVDVDVPQASDTFVVEIL